MENEQRSRKPYTIITGKDLTTITENDMEPIIENLVYKGDYIFINAQKKTGKSIFAQHMTANLSTGKDFLDFFKVDKENPDRQRLEIQTGNGR